MTEEKKEEAVESKTDYRTGFLKKVEDTKVFESGNKVKNALLLSGTKEEPKWTQVNAWNAMADVLENAQSGERWELKGKVTMEADKNDPSKQYENINVEEAHQYTKEKIVGKIQSIETGKTKNDTDMTKIFVIAEQSAGGSKTTEPYNIELYGKDTKKAVDFKKGQMIEVDDWAKNFSYKKEEEVKVSKTFRNPRSMDIVGKSKKQGAAMSV